MVLLRLTKMEQAVVTMEPVSVEYRLFSGEEEAEQWLRANRFEYEHRDFFKGDGKEWCHEQDWAMSYVDVEFFRLDADDKSIYTRTKSGDEWLAELEEDREFRSSVAKRMLKMQEPLKDIMHYTRFTEGEIRNLANRLKIDVLD